MSDKVIYTKESLVWVKNIFRENENKCCLFADNTCICISLLHKPILYHLEDQDQDSHYSDILFLLTFFLKAVLKTKENMVSCDKGIN